MGRRKEQEEPPADPFVAKLEEKMTLALDSFEEPKDLNALFANAIRFLLVKYKIQDKDDGGGFFGEN